MNFLLALLSGFGQTVFQSNTIFGLVIVIMLAVISPVGLLLAFIGNTIGILVAYFFKVKESIILSGTYGFNGALVGLMISYYVKNIPLAVVFTVVGSLLATLIFYFLIKNNIFPFAGPYVLIALSIALLLRFFH